MTRTTAREIAIQLGFAAVSSKEDISALMERFFSPEHYETLRGENELYAELPDAKQMAYIRRLTELTMENRSEIDGFIERYAKGWKLERISKTALAVMRCAICSCVGFSPCLLLLWAKTAPVIIRATAIVNIIFFIIVLVDGIRFPYSLLIFLSRLIV